MDLLKLNERELFSDYFDNICSSGFLPHVTVVPLIAVVFSIKYILKHQEHMKIHTTLKPHQAL